MGKASTYQQKKQGMRIHVVQSEYRICKMRYSRGHVHLYAFPILLHTAYFVPYFYFYF